MSEIIGKEWEERLDSFALAEPVGGPRFVCGGLFFNRVEDYLKGLAKIVKRVINEEDAYGDFEKFLREKGYTPQGDSIYSRELVTRWQKAFKLVKSENTGEFYRFSKGAAFKVYDLSLGAPSDIQKHAGLVFLRVKGYEDREMSAELKWELRDILIQEWIRLSEDRWVKEYLTKVKELMGFVKYALPDAYYKYPLSRLYFYLFPVEFDKFLNAVVISRVGLYRRRDETKKKLWKDILSQMEEIKVKQDLEDTLKDKGRSLEEIGELLQTALQEDSLNRLRKDWILFIKKLLMGESSFIVGAFLKGEKGSEEAQVEYGKYLLPQKNIQLLIFYERGTETMIEELKTEVKNMKYVKDVKINFGENVNPIPIDSLFGKQNFFNILKGIERNDRTLQNMESVQLLYALVYFTARLLVFQRVLQKNQNRLGGYLMLLNTELKEDERYAFWDYVSFLYDYFGLPVQTVTRRFLEKLKDKNGGEAAKKNMLISLYKDAKVLSFGFDGFNLPENITVYVFVEKPSGKFMFMLGDMAQAGGVRNYLYEVYRIRVQNRSASVELEDKFIVLANGYGEDAQWLRKFIRENSEKQDIRFCFITPLEKSFLLELYEEFARDSQFLEKSIYVRYRELKTAYLSKKSENHCFVIYTPQFRALMEKLGIILDRDAAVIAIKPARPQKEEDIYHPALQVFFTEKVGWMKEEVYSEKKNLFLFTLIAFSMFESESAIVPYSKLDLWSKERSTYLKIKRKDAEGVEREYLFSLKPLLYELLDFMRHIPGIDKI